MGNDTLEYRKSKIHEKLNKENIKDLNIIYNELIQLKKYLIWM